MRKIILPLLIVLILGISVYAQNAQVSPVSNLDGSNASVVNGNMGILQTGVNNLYSVYTTISGYFSSGILGTTHGGTGKNSSNWTSGDYVYMSSTGVWGHTGLVHGVQIFTTSGTFTAPTGVTKVYISMVGGGGGGGGVNSGIPGGGGGGSGAWTLNYPYTVVAGNSYTVTLGGGGSGVSGAVGTDGGSTTFDSFSVNGGTAGHVGSGGDSNGGAGGVGGLSSSASVSTAAQTGGLASQTGGNGAKAGGVVGGGGGGSPFGKGGDGGGDSANGNNGTNGSGGGGSGRNSGGQNAGGNGGSGICIVFY